jgi:hypothetical protein
MAASVAQREMTAEPENPFWSRVRDLFQEAVALEGPARAALLASCDDARVCDEVTALLESHESAGGFLEVPVFKRKGIPSGTSIGPYRIVCEIGEGGMGSVFLGVRDDDEFEQRVAIKLIRGGAAGESIMRRFRQERQILAALEHPNIARLLDGGTTADGLPYLVMEYVEGTAIDEYCDSHACSITTKLHLFLLLCEAVQYAHRNLVIHRDIKPANVLITTDGVPKLLDFGIAKLISHDTTDATVTRIMTPDYASPEQCRRRRTSTRWASCSIDCWLGQSPSRRIGGPTASPHDRARTHTHFVVISRTSCSWRCTWMSRVVMDRSSSSPRTSAATSRAIPWSRVRPPSSIEHRSSSGATA